ncbi:hypothetical protein [Kitasatospora sp. GAS1066B]|uniref:hypothetical protein n=1 Tax=Kitasatospora sp. GAS1066B TaxID=3156271 RepID=UPI003511A805
MTAALRTQLAVGARELLVRPVGLTIEDLRVQLTGTARLTPSLRSVASLVTARTW